MTNQQKYDYQKRILATYDIARAFMKQGATIASVSREVGLCESTVKRYLEDRDAFDVIWGAKAPAIYKAISNKLEKSSHKTVSASEKKSSKKK